MTITPREMQVLEMVAGKRPWAEWGAWLGACLDALRGSGLITDYIGSQPSLTDAGRAVLQGGAA
ncbi:hypothetical protein X740_33540 [Mesorhizobium sp. LNHC221B00]|uniref:hypothetical protein n=1 Tax=Mesorhizobium sp. LNHC221B00 TaxID=1287233 RepID=UPI0003CEED0D|nr:hypothetical protein [Mesorhizobium sp. LNHC221B00]ESY72081.1 hypothetical protein X740_33540 [Mesorhizobium sp. LNHC221B00]